MAGNALSGLAQCGCHREARRSLGPGEHPRGDTMFIGGNRTTAYSVADGTVLWTSSYNRNLPVGGFLSGILGLSADGTRLFGTC